MNKQEIKTYNERLSLLNNNDNKTKIALIQEIYNYISGYNDFEATELRNDIVILFLRNTEQINESIDVVKDVKEQLIKAFDNISTIANENTTSGELNTFYFLNELYSCYKNSISPEYKEQSENDFSNLLENLEKIKVIFGLTDDNRKEYFPISSLLYNIIGNDELKNKLNNSETIQTLFLALQIYKINPELKEYENIRMLLKNLNLKFIDYLIEDGVRRIGGDSWKANYEKNGTLVLHSTKNNKVLIRNINKEYFDQIEKFKTDYGMSDIQSEKNNNNKDIAYYVEYQSSSDLESINIAEKIEQANKGIILDILKLIFDQEYYNVLFDEALFSTNNKISLINPFCNKDKFVILNSNGNINTREDCLTAVSEWLEKFGLFVLTGNGINVINLGTLVSLEKISHVSIDKLNLNDNTINFNGLLNNWLDNVKEDKRDAFYKFFERYKTELKYINTTDDLFNKTYDKDFFIPYHIDKKILEKLGFDKRIKKEKIHKVKCEKDFFLGTQTIKDTSGNDYSDYEKEYSEELKDYEEFSGEIEVVVDKQNKKIYFDDDISLYKNFSESIEKLNSHMLPIDLNLSNGDVDDIVKMMESFKDAINEIHKEKIPLKDISTYRISHHLLLIRMTKEKVNDWMKLLKYHQIIRYKDIIKKLPFDGENGVLYVPKDPSRADSTYKFIFNNYISTYSKRNKIDIYDQKISFPSAKNGYLVNDNKIKKIVFLFDLTQNGTATTNVLDYHLNQNNERLLPPSEKNTVEHDKFFQFNVKGKRVHLSTIIKQNKPTIHCHFIYAGQTGINNVESFMEESYPELKLEIIDPIKKLDDNMKWDSEKEDLCKSIYGQGKLKGTLKEDSYPVIREFNQPKQNIMSEELMDIEKVVAIFCQRPEKT